jgi:TatD DNase family protein
LYKISMSKAIRYIDIHGHVNFPEYDADREEVIKRAAETGVGMITVGTDIESSKRAILLAETHDNMWATVGIHPTEISNDMPLAAAREGNLSRRVSEEGGEKVYRSEKAAEETSEFQDLRRLALHPKIVAIGECGLDYFHCEESDIPAQIEVFEQQIAIANEIKKPLMLHVRNGPPGRQAGKRKNKHGGNAYKDTLDILKKSAKVPFNFHFFAGSTEDMKNIIEVGGTLSFTGVLTFTHDYDEIVKSAPLEKIMSETDCPYVSPVPHRGKRNEPVFVIEVVKAIAKIRGEDEEKVRMVLLENARKFFSLPR